MVIHYKIIFNWIFHLIKSFIISFYTACDFELQQQPELNGKYVILTIWHNWIPTIWKGQVSCERIQYLAYELTH